MRDRSQPGHAVGKARCLQHGRHPGASGQRLPLKRVPTATVQGWPAPSKVCDLPQQVGTGTDIQNRPFGLNTTAIFMLLFLNFQQWTKGGSGKSSSLASLGGWRKPDSPSPPARLLGPLEPWRAEISLLISQHHSPAACPRSLYLGSKRWPSQSVGQLPRGHPAPLPDRLCARGQARMTVI